MGIENEDGTVGAQVAFNTPYLEDELAIAFGYNPKFITGISPMAGGVVPAGGEAEVTVSVSADQLNEGTYYNDVAVNSNDPENPSGDATIELRVTGFPSFEVLEDEIDFGLVYVSQSKTKPAKIKNNGTKEFTLMLLDEGMNDYVNFEWEGDQTILPGQNYSLDITYAPGMVEMLEDTVKFVTNIEGADTINFRLIGEAANPPEIAVSPDRLISYVEAGDVVNLGILLTNNGGADLEYRIPATFWSRASNAPVRSMNAPARMMKPGMAQASPLVAEPTQPTAIHDDFGYSWSLDEMKSSELYDWMDISSTPDIGVGTDEGIHAESLAHSTGSDVDDVKKVVSTVLRVFGISRRAINPINSKQ